MTNTVVEYWTQSGGASTKSITGERFAAATAGEDYEDICGTLNFLPMLPYSLRWEGIHPGAERHQGRYIGGSGTAEGWSPSLESSKFS